MSENRTQATFGQFVPPNHIEAEQATLGAMLIQRSAVDRAMAILRKEDFYRETHQMIFDVVVLLVQRSEPVDIVTVPHELDQRGQLAAIGGMAYIAALFDTVPTAANVEFYAESVAHHAVRRRIIEAGMMLAQIGQAESETPEEATQQAEQCVMAIAGNRRGEATASSIGSLLMGQYDRSEAMSERRGQMLGLPTGLAGVDRLTSGLQEPDFLVLAGRPGCGKTSLLLHMALHIAVRLKRPVVLFSLEMSRQQIAARVACQIAGVDYFRLQSGKNMTEADWGRLANAVKLCYSAPLIIDDAPAISAAEMASTLRRVRRDHCDLAFAGVDYLQLMSPHSPMSASRQGREENRTQAVSAISRDLKKLARTERIPLMALSQLSRAVEGRENKRPMLSDLRESGQIEADADLVAFLYNEQYYARMRTPASEVAPGTVDEVEFNVAKHRNGPTGTIKIGFQPTYTRFADIAIRDDAPTGF